jgi:hypothetical protein
MATQSVDDCPLERQKKVRVTHLLAPHWKALAVGLTAVAAETAAGLLDPWPLKIVLDMTRTR